MTFWELKNKVIDTGHETHFFDSDTLKFFGERLSDMRLLKGTAEVTDVCGEKHTCYIVSATRRRNWSGPCKPYVYHHCFDTTTFRHITR